MATTRSKSYSGLFKTMDLVQDILKTIPGGRGGSTRGFLRAIAARRAARPHSMRWKPAFMVVHKPDRPRISSSTTIPVHHEPRYRGAPTRILLLLMAPLRWMGRHRPTRPYIAGLAPRRGSGVELHMRSERSGGLLARVVVEQGMGI